MKKALIVSPYLDHLGGGERYMLSVSQVLESLGYSIYFGWDNLEEIDKLSLMLGVNLKNPLLDPKVKGLYFKGNPIGMYLATKPYDVVVYLSDGSIPLLGGKRNILHMQVPFHGVGGKSLSNKIKQQFIHSVIVNSEFTKKVVDLEFGINSVVLYPPVTPVSPGIKENIILSVGRFDPSLNTKHQDILIKAFKLLSPKLPGWKLVLAGGSSSDEWITQLKKQAEGYAVEFVTNASHEALTNLYAKSYIYWHAAGYGVDQVKNPELTEHFGISTVEAVSAGCIPLVVPYGGQSEIVTDPQFHWESIEGLIDQTLALISSSVKANFSIDDYSVAAFSKKLQSLL